LVPVVAAHAPEDRAFPQFAGLALDPRHLRAIVYDQVVARVFAEGDKHRKPNLAKSKHYSQSGSIADVFGMLHHLILPKAPAGPCPKQTTRSSLK
jgi:hypothetical protein